MKRLLCVALAVGVFAGRANAQEKRGFDALSAALVLEKTLVKTIATAEPSLVSIARIKWAGRKPRKPADFFGPIEPDRDDPTSPDFTPNEFGSGIIVAPLEKSDERFILTNYHVVKGGPVDKAAAGKSDSRLYVRLSNRRGFFARIIAADPRSDLAVLRIDYKALKMKPAEVKPLKFAAGDTYRKGQLVISLGNPYAQARDGSASASWGMIANISRRPKPAGRGNGVEARKKETLHHLGTLLHVDTRLSIGTSGGALLNLKGELIGITTSLAALEGYESSVGYAIPFTADMRRIVRTLAKGLEVEYGYLGISPQDVSPSQLAVLPGRLKHQHGAMAVSVHPHSPAARGGVRPGDVILAVDGRPVFDRYDLMRMVGRRAPGSRIQLRIWRVEKLLTIKIDLGKWPVLNDEEIIATARRFPAWRGLSVDYPTARHKFLQLPYRYHRAVVLLKVENAALRKRSDLQPGDYVSHVDGTPVETPAQFYAAVRERNGAVTLRLVGGETVRVPK
ncbi:MAG: S1C family serine protease [Planctomycetaceae bacterium]